MSHPLTFSRRLPADLSDSPLHLHMQAFAGAIDLAEANPTRCGFTYPQIDLPILGPGTWNYVPDAQGSLAARQVLAETLAARDRAVDPQNLILTASTSEAYGMVLKLLCDPGDKVATGAPSYPLVQHLAELECVGSVTYAWVYEDGRWRIDFASIAEALAQGVRALVLIAPNNPTGSCARPEELQELATLCNARGVVVIIDEVFAPYRTDAPPSGFPYAAFERCCVLDGLSKAAALPQLKLGWIALHGDAAWVEAARQRLVWIADTYLSVNTPVQVALPQILQAAPLLQAQIRARLVTNRACLLRQLACVPTVDVLPSDGGWYAVLRVPQRFEEDTLVMQILADAQAKLHPGYFYDLPSNGYLVTGLLNPTAGFDAAWKRIAGAFARYF